jgi:hypothetical protein
LGTFSDPEYQKFASRQLSTLIFQIISEYNISGPFSDTIRKDILELKGRLLKISSSSDDWDLETIPSFIKTISDFLESLSKEKNGNSTFNSLVYSENMKIVVKSLIEMNSTSDIVNLFVKQQNPNGMYNSFTTLISSYNSWCSGDILSYNSPLNMDVVYN